MDCKIPDVGPVLVEMCKLKKIGWTLNVQRLDGIKVPILVPGASEVSLCIKPGHFIHSTISNTLRMYLFFGYNYLHALYASLGIVH